MGNVRKTSHSASPLPSAERILHFSLGPSFDGKFLFHPVLSATARKVCHFAIGQSGYLYDRAAWRRVASEYLRALLLLAKGVGATNRQSIAYCHTTKFALPSLLLCRIFGVGQVVYFNHGVPYVGYGGIVRTALRLLERANVAVAHRFITVSPEMVGLLRPSAVDNPWQHSTKPGSSSGIRETDFVPWSVIKKRAPCTPQQGVRYLYAGRLQARKGIFILLDAWRRHIARFPGDQLWLCGFTIEELSHHYSCESLTNVEIHGYVTDMKSIYDQVDVVVSPSFHEGFGYTLLEGAARGCCIISSAVPGPDVMFTRWMHHQLFEAGDSDSLSRVMAILSGSIALLATSRCLSYRSARRFAMHKVSYPLLSCRYSDIMTSTLESATTSS